MKTIKSEIIKGRQGSGLEETIELGDFKISLKIYSDSYDLQSYAYVSVFSKAALTWNRLHSIHYSNMKTPSPGYCKNTKVFQADRTTLLEMAKFILGDKND